MADAKDDPIGTAKAAEILGFSPRKVHRLANTGAIPIIGKLNARGDLLFSQHVIEELAKHQGETPETPPAG